MRHLFHQVNLLPRRVIETSRFFGLIAPSRAADGIPSGHGRTPSTAVDISAVTFAADIDQAMTLFAAKESEAVAIHRRPACQRLDKGLR